MHWTFATNRDSYFKIRDNDEIKWSSAGEVKKGNIICFYTGHPYSEIGFIFKAKTDLFEDEQIRRDRNRPAILVNSKIILPNPISIKELKDNQILSQWGAVKRNFMGSHFKMSDEKWNELKKLILEKNPELKSQIEDLEKEDEPKFDTCFGTIRYYDLNAGRAHIVRDICYLISQNDKILENNLFDILRENVKDEEYWKAYFQRSKKDNSPEYNLNAARTLGLVFKNKLELTELGNELVDSITPDELFTYNYGSGVKKFFYELALENDSIKTAMKILKEKERLRFYTPLCDRTNKVMWKYKETENGFICEENKHPECNDCDRDFLNHIKESSLPFETLRETKGNDDGFVFWMCSRVTPMHLTGSKPGYSGNNIYWDEKAAEELENGNDSMDKAGIWKITPGEGHIRKILWDLFVKNEIIGIGWFGKEIDYSEFKTIGDVKKELFKFYNKPMDSSAKMIWDFTNNIKIGDIIVANSGYKSVLGIGIVKSEYMGPQNPANDFIRPEFQYYVHFRKIKWLINDEIEFSSQIFDQRTLSPVYEDKWNKIKEAYIEKNKDYKSIFDEIEKQSKCSPENIIKTLYDEFEKNFYSIEEGHQHDNIYDFERQKVKKYYELIENDAQAKYNTEDPPINHLLPIKQPAIAPVAVGAIKAYGYTDEELPGLTDAVYNLLKNLNETDDKNRQKELISSFKSGPYKKGFQTAMLTPVMYYLNPDFLFINKKTVSSFRFISRILKENKNINGDLGDYIDNNGELKKLLNKLNGFIHNLNFESFDAFCHWLCSKQLGNYAEDQEKFNRWLLNNCPQEDPEEVINENEFLKFLKETYSHEMQISLGELERGKNVILYGPPGSGKTVLSKIVSEKYLGKNAYSLYTVHSGTDYYDLICRIVPQINGDGNLVYSKEPRFLLDALLSGKVLILDEINRTQIDTALGIFFTYLERDHRISDAEQIREILKKETDEELEINDLRAKLSDFRIIGTLNVYDKTFLFKLGDALKRRFTFIEITTKKDLIEKLASSEEFKKEFMNACDYQGDLDTANTIIDVFSNLNNIKPLGIGILKDSLQFSSNFNENAADLSISSLIVPFFENDLNYSNILSILENNNLNVSINKLRSLNFGTSDINGI